MRSAAPLGGLAKKPVDEVAGCRSAKDHEPESHPSLVSGREVFATHGATCVASKMFYNTFVGRSSANSSDGRRRTTSMRPMAMS